MTYAELAQLTHKQRLQHAEKLLEEWIDNRLYRLSFKDKQELIPIRDLLFTADEDLFCGDGADNLARIACTDQPIKEN